MAPYAIDLQDQTATCANGERAANGGVRAGWQCNRPCRQAV